MKAIKYNLHTHTTRCRHAQGSDREMVETAIAEGFDVLGFSDHSPQVFPVDDYYSTFRMFPEEAAEYAESVRALQKEYASDIKILLGFEAEYYPLAFDALRELVAPLQLDYMIMGQHFVGNEYDEDSFYSSKCQRGDRFLMRYVEQVREGLDTGAFTYIAHPDIVNYQGGDAFYYEQMRTLCRYCREKRIPLEFNMLGYLNSRNYPDPRFWKIAAEVGNQVVLGYDAHDPGMLRRYDIYEACLALLNGLGLKPMNFEEILFKNEAL